MLMGPLWQETATHSLCIITKQLLTATTVFLQGPDSMRRTDLFNAVSLNTVSCGTHNTDTNRKSLSVCFKSQMAQMFRTSLIIKLACFSVRYWLDMEECGISLGGGEDVYNELRENPVSPLDTTALQLSPQSSGTYTLKICWTTTINISPKCRCCMLQ